MRNLKTLSIQGAAILVATDFSEHSKRVVQYAFDLKRIFDASLYMLYVIETGHAFFRDGGNVVVGGTKQGREVVRQVLVELDLHRRVSV